MNANKVVGESEFHIQVFMGEEEEAGNYTAYYDYKTDRLVYDVGDLPIYLTDVEQIMFTIVI